MLPSILSGNQLSSNRLMRSIEEAKNDAAEFVIMQIFSNPKQPLPIQSEVQPQIFSVNDSALPHSPAVNSADSVTSIFNVNGQYQNLGVQSYVIDTTGFFI